MKRRDFIRTSIAMGAMAAIGESVSAQEPKPVRIGVIGVGNRGTGLTNTLLQLPDVEVRAVCDVAPERAANAQAIVEKKTGKRPEAYTKDETDFTNLVARDDLDAVVIATPWQWHARMAVAAMRAGKYAGVEVPAAITVDECWELVKTSEETGVPCMMLENVCYFQNALAILRMVREGVFGEMLDCEGGYQHNCRFLMFDDKGQLTWRGEHAAEKNGNLYPTHPIGPISQWININRGDRYTQLVSMSTPAKGLQYFAAQKLGADHPLAKRSYAQGDVNTTLLKTANGLTVTLYFDLMTYRPYDLIFRAQGVKGIYLGTHEKLCVEGLTGEQWEPFEPYLQKFEHPLWRDLEAEAKKNDGHGGADYITLHEFTKAVRNKTTPPQDVYDAATWSAIFPLSIESVAKDSAAIAFPDFTSGKWKANPPLPIYGA